MYVRLLLFVSLYFCASSPVLAQIETYQLSLIDSTQNILYTYFPNKVAVKNLPAGARLLFEDKYITPIGNSYILSPSQPGRCKFYIYDKEDNQIFTKDFLAQDLDHNSGIQLGIVNRELASVSDILANPALTFDCPDCKLKPWWRVVHYQITLRINGIDETKTLTAENLTGVPFDKDLQRMIAKMKNGDAIFIEGIKAYGPDEKLRNLSSITLQIAFNLTDQEHGNGDKKKLRPEVRVIVDMMAKDNYLRRRGYGLLEKLQDVATDSELIRLIDNENAAVKCYAFEALIERKNVEVFPVLMKHINDTAYISMFWGCSSTYRRSNMHFLTSVYPRFGNNNTTYKLTEIERNIIDSMLLFGNAIIADNWIKDLILRRMKPEPKYYRRIRALALTGKRPVSSIILAKFKNKNDVELIQKLFSYGDDSYGILSARAFPHQSFYPFLKKIFDKELAGLEPNNYFGEEWGLLCEALAQYPTPETYHLFEQITKIKEETEYQSINRSLMLAIQKYPNQIFEPLKEKIMLDDSHRITKTDLEIEDL